MLHVSSRQIECLESMVSLTGPPAPAGLFRRHWAWHMTKNVSVEPAGVTVWSQCPLLFLSAQSGVFIKWDWRVQKRISTYPIVHRYQFPVCCHLSFLVSTRAVKINWFCEYSIYIQLKTFKIFSAINTACVFFFFSLWLLYYNIGSCYHSFKCY